MKAKTISIFSIFLFIISFFLLENIMLSQEFTFNYYRYILINIFRVHKIFSQPEYGMTHIFFYSILLYSILNLLFCSNRIYLLINQLFLSIYFILNLYPITIGNANFQDKISVIYFFINILIVIMLHFINLYQLKYLKN